MVLSLTRRRFEHFTLFGPMPIKPTHWQVAAIGLLFFTSHVISFAAIQLTWNEKAAAPVADRGHLNWPMIVVRIAKNRDVEKACTEVWAKLSESDREIVAAFAEKRVLPADTRSRIANAIDGLNLEDRRRTFGWMIQPHSSSKMFMATLAGSLFFITGAAFVLLSSKTKRYEFLSMHATEKRTAVALGLRDWIAWQPTVLAVNALAQVYSQKAQPHPAELYFVESHSIVAWALYIAAISVAVPLAEEIFFRGVLQTWIVEKLGPFLGIAISGTLFGISHSSTWPDPIPLVLLGIVIGVSYQRAKSFYAPFVIHACNNTLMLALLMLLKLSQ